MDRGLVLIQLLWMVHVWGIIAKHFPGAVISAIPQDLKFDGEETTTEIGDNTTMREGVTVNQGYPWPLARPLWGKIAC